MLMDDTSDLSPELDSALQDDARDDPSINLSILEDARDDAAKRVRLMLDIPDPGVPDAEIDFVLYYLSFCYDWYQVDQPEIVWNHDQALTDLSLLTEATKRVTESVKAAKKRAASAKHAEKQAKTSTCDLTDPDSTNALWERYNLDKDSEKMLRADALRIGLPEVKPEPERTAEVIELKRRGA